MIPYFSKLETDQQFEGPLHRKTGPLPVRRVARERWSGYSKAAADAFELVGMKFIEDQNGAVEDGFSP